MRITEEQIKHTAKLARLEVREEKIHTFTKQIGDIVDFANQLNEVDASGIDSTAYILDVYNVFRKDEIEESSNRDELLQNAGSKEAGYITVSRVVE